MAPQDRHPPDPVDKLDPHDRALLAELRHLKELERVRQAVPRHSAEYERLVDAIAARARIVFTLGHRPR